MLPERHIDNQETDKKEEKQPAAEKHRLASLVNQQIAQLINGQ